MPGPENTLEPALLEHLVAGFLAAVPAGAGTAETLRAIALATLAAMKPADIAAALLAIEGLAAHYAAMDQFARAAAEADDKAAARLRSNAAAMARTTRAAFKAAEARGPKPPPAARAKRAEPPPPPPAEAGPRKATLLERAAIPRPLPKRWDEMTLEERRVAFGYTYEPKTPVPPEG